MKHAYRGYCYERKAGPNGYSVFRITKAGKPLGAELSHVECRRRIDALCDFVEPYTDPARIVATDCTPQEIRNAVA